jgi:acetate kinase
MSGEILVLNTGSSSIKFSLFVEGSPEELSLRCQGRIQDLGGRAHFAVEEPTGRALIDRDLNEGQGVGQAEAVRALLDWLDKAAFEERLIAAGHRVVHGGEELSDPVRVDKAVLARLDALVPLAPLHQPHNLAGIRLLGALRPGLPQVACFDTAFHRTQPPVARAFALPRELSETGIRRYGFHGLSYEYIASILPRYLRDAAQGRIIVAHLGNGASLCALKAGKSIASTMGFTALDGLPMGTRCGALDPGVVLYLLTERGMDPNAITDVLYNRSGLLGVSGVSHDMRMLLSSDEPTAAKAIDLFIYRIGRELGSLTAALGGLDALVFTGGIGEHAVPIRARVCRDAAWLGIFLDEEANQQGSPCITKAGGAVSAWVIPTNEEWMIARHTCAIICS